MSKRGGRGRWGGRGRQDGQHTTPYNTLSSGNILSHFPQMIFSTLNIYVSIMVRDVNQVNSKVFFFDFNIIYVDI